jgi:hypothetical protein
MQCSLIRLFCPLSPLLILACGSPTEPVKAPEPGSTAVPTAAAASTDEPTAKPTHEPPDKAAPIATTGDPPPKESGDYTITFRDCDKLVSNYERVLRASEMTKLEAKKFPPKFYGKAKEEVDKAVQQGVDGWRAQCQSIMGTVQVRKRIACAADANDLDRFNGCWDGKFDQE